MGSSSQEPEAAQGHAPVDAAQGQAPADAAQREPAEAAQREAAPAEAAAARPVEEGGDAYHTRIVIRPGGEVLIENLSMDLIELAELLDPDAKVTCEAPEPLPE